MTIKETFRFELRKQAEECIQSEQLTRKHCIINSPIMDITARAEKMHIKQNVKELEKSIKIDENFGIDCKVENKMLEICYVRLKTLEAK